MTRLRVHELAKELNMDNKDLIDRLAKLGIQVKNHMSTLTDAAILKIRQMSSEAKSEKVEEKRIGREVIRRRKKVEMQAEEAPVEAEEEALEPAPVPVAERPEEPEIESPVEPVAEIPAETEETEPVVAPEPKVIPEPAPVVERARVVAPPAPPKHEAARIIKPAPVREVPPAEEVKPAAAKIVAPPPPVEPTPPAPKPVEAAPPVVESAVQKPAAAPTPPPAAQPEAKPPAEEEEEEDKGKKKTKKRRRKKAKKEEPARIIKLPEILSEEIEEEPDLTELAARFIGKAPDTAEAKDQKRRKPEEADKARTGRRKEVFQKEDLYTKKELAAQDRGKPGKAAFREPPKPEPVVQKVGKKRIKIDEAITVANLAKQMGMKAGEVIKKLLLLGLQANINQAVDFDTAALVASDFEFEVEKTAFEEEEVLQVKQDKAEDLTHRPPVVTVMGHVDHGKTSLLDAIRHTNVIGGEAGGITQHIGAYHVRLDKGDIVFLDTPGHEAFTSMRARGAKVTDIVILVVAADDGVMQQTIEAINHAKAAEVPIIVAINKIDKPNANVDRVKRELSEHGLITEEWGGNTTMVEISAKKRLGIDDLLEMVLLQAELLELKANPHKEARGRVIEAKLDKGRGPVASVLVQEGTLKAGDAYVCGIYAGRVRNMFDDRGNKIDAARPSIPVEVLGFSGVPNAGDDFIVLADERQARNVAEHRLLKLREKELSRTSKITLENLFDQIQEGEVKELKLVLKTDVHGSLEAIADSLVKLSTGEVKVNIIHSGTGAITETDVMLASASNAIVIGFNIRSDSKVQELAEAEKVDVRFYDVIYQLLDDIKAAVVGMLKPIYKENVMGRAEVRQTFQVPKMGMIAGCYVLDGRVERNAKTRVVRDGVVVYDGKIGSLRRFKDDVKEVKAGFECGIGIENFNDIKVNDILEAYEVQEIKQVLEPEHERKAGS